MVVTPSKCLPESAGVLKSGGSRPRGGRSRDLSRVPAGESADDEKTQLHTARRRSGPSLSWWDVAPCSALAIRLG